MQIGVVDLVVVNYGTNQLIMESKSQIKIVLIAYVK